VILAFSEPELLESVLQDGLKRCTRYTITSPSRLNEAVNHVRQTSLAYSVEEMGLGTSSVAAPIFGANRALSASLAIVVRSSTDLRRLAPAVGAAALGVTRTLTGMRPPVEHPEQRAAR
jgi:DNA-binding IclR family transcriptional regulator